MKTNDFIDLNKSKFLKHHQPFSKEHIIKDLDNIT